MRTKAPENRHAIHLRKVGMRSIQVKQTKKWGAAGAAGCERGQLAIRHTTRPVLRDTTVNGSSGKTSASS